jgi:hypothetical protein
MSDMTQASSKKKPLMADEGWVPFDGNYIKKFYDIRLKDGRVWRRCWPNAGKFNHPDGSKVKVEYVTHVRLRKTRDVIAEDEAWLQTQSCTTK